MAISVFDMFSIGIGPSSSHTVGPMRAARRFLVALHGLGLLDSVETVVVELYDSLALTGKAHGSDKGILLGLEGETPENVDIAGIDERLKRIRAREQIALLGGRSISFRETKHLIYHRRQRLPHHPNGIRFTALDLAGEQVAQHSYYSVGGGFVVSELAAANDSLLDEERVLPCPFANAEELVQLALAKEVSISQIMLENERCFRSEAEIRSGLLKIWAAMQECVQRGCSQEGLLPGGLQVRRRAPALYHELTTRPEAALRDPLSVLDWVDLYALAVNEENAAGGRVVTAPTNGAAGILPAVLHY